MLYTVVKVLLVDACKCYLLTLFVSDVACFYFIRNNKMVVDV